MTTVTGSQGSPGAQTQTLTGPASTAEVNLVADPAPLGLAAFGITTLVLSTINTGWIDASATPIVLALAIPFGGVAQALAGMWAFRRGNTFAATAFTRFGAFWISYYLLVEVFARQVTVASSLPPIVGTYLLAWGIFTAYMFFASLAGAKAVSSVLLFLTLTFVALAIGAYGSNLNYTHAGGWLGLVTAILALYTSFADVTNANFKRVVLPTTF
jgi:succinate-acetate transporter protein